MLGRLFPARWNGQLSITITLATAISLLVLLSVGSVLGTGVWLAARNTLSLLSENGNRNLADTVGRIELHLRPAEDKARFIARQIAEGSIDPHDRATFGLLLTGALAGVPQIRSVSFFDPNLKTFVAARLGDGNLGLGELDHSQDPRFHEFLAEMPEEPHSQPRLNGQRVGRMSRPGRATAPVHRVSRGRLRVSWSWRRGPNSGLKRARPLPGLARRAVLGHNKDGKVPPRSRWRPSK